MSREKNIYLELLKFNQEYVNRGGNPFPSNVLQDVADNYSIIQQNTVKRNMTKKNLFAALIFHTCISRGFTRSTSEAAEFAKLHTHGIARGDDY